MDLRSPNLNKILSQWIDEDLGSGDLTRFAVQNQISCANWISKQNGIFCGGELISLLFQKIDPQIKVKRLINDGQAFVQGDHLLEIQGPASSLLAGERITLNIAMRLSGIATKTASLVSQLTGTNVLLADTRKTTPGLRVFEKYAVKCGGGVNHRLGLHDAAMLKENHIAWSGGVTAAVKKLKHNIPWTTKIIVEAETESQAKEAVSAGADGILLDEMSVNQISSLVPQLRQLASQTTTKSQSKDVVIEISGINTKDIRAYALTGVDLISSSAPITKSTWIDFSMRFNEAT